MPQAAKWWLIYDSVQGPHTARLWAARNAAEAVEMELQRLRYGPDDAAQFREDAKIVPLTNRQVSDLALGDAEG